MEGIRPMKEPLVMPVTVDSERRRDTRTPIDRPAKLRCVQTGKYYTAVTQDLSAGGALVEVHHPSLLVSGQQVEIGIAWSNRQMLLARDELIPGVVTRSLGLGGKQHVAIQFQTRQMRLMTA